MSLAANVIYHDERARHFERCSYVAKYDGKTDPAAHVVTFYQLRRNAHAAAWRVLVLSEAGEG